MKAVCVLTGTEINWPCAARGCSLYGDCLVNYEKATAKPPMTNADRINAMSIEEKAAFLTDQTEYHEAAFSKATWADPYGNSYRTKQDAIDKWIEWLQSPCGGAKK